MKTNETRITELLVDIDDREEKGQGKEEKWGKKRNGTPSEGRFVG